MKSKQKISSVLAILVFLILMVFSGFIYGSTHAWFTSGSGVKISFEVEVGDLDVTIRQILSGTNEEVIIYRGGEYFNEINLASKENDSKYIFPDINPVETSYDLNLEMSNADIGVGSVKIKYKVDFYACGLNSDTLLNSDIIGYTAPSGSTSGFVYNSADGYYYYRKADNTLDDLASNATVKLMTKFKINYDDAYASSNASTIKMVLNIVTYQ